MDEEQNAYGVQDMFNDIKNDIYNSVFATCDMINFIEPIIAESKDIDMHTLKLMLIFAVTSISLFSISIPLIVNFIPISEWYIPFIILSMCVAVLAQRLYIMANKYYLPCIQTNEAMLRFIIVERAMARFVEVFKDPSNEEILDFIRNLLHAAMLEESDTNVRILCEMYGKYASSIRHN